MDVIELLSRLGQVEPADQAVLDAALGQFNTSANGRRVRRARPLIAAAGVVAVATAGVVVLPGVIGGRPPTPAPSTAASSAPHSSPPHSSPPHSSIQARPGIGAILTAFNASRNDILRVTKTMKGPEGTIGKTIIWIDPVGAGRGTVVQSRILTFTLGGARLLDWTLRYTEPRRRPAVCDGFFLRPRIETLPAPGPRGIATIVYYSGHFWGRSAVAVQAATVPSADSLRACLRPGDWGDLGSRVLGRTKTTEFAATANELAGPGFEHLWVDSAAFLPVKLLESDDAERITFGFKFLPPTPANKALLRLPIPTGFVKRQL